MDDQGDIDAACLCRKAHGGSRLDGLVSNYDGAAVSQLDHLFYRVARTFVREHGFSADDFLPAEDISTIREQARRYHVSQPGSGLPPRWYVHMTDYQYSRTRRPIAAAGGDGLLHLFVVGRNLDLGMHRMTCTEDGTYSFVETAGRSVNASEDRDVVRWGALVPTDPDGYLRPYGQRMVELSNTYQGSGGVPVRDENLLTSGVAWWDAARHVLSVVVPRHDRNRFEIRSIPTR
jgi:hypothetical protein